eukprot:15120.XXX_1029661_1036037_1 [CDS] Oithona nana genome sequencing.
MSECPLRTDTELLTRLTSHNPLIPLPMRSWPNRNPKIAHAPKRNHGLSAEGKQKAVGNALRYFPAVLHDQLATEFAKELEDFGHIYMYRYLPSFPLRAYPLDDIKAKTREGASIIHMILNNLDPKVAQFPEELVTYGGNGQVFSNWAQFWLTLHYLMTMSQEQTLVMYSGHPMGLFPSNAANPRLIITNGMVIPNYSTRDDYDRMFALGVTMYGQMTAGSYCYIGPQGIVHGTTLTLLNAGRKYLGLNSLSGKVFLTSGLGGMSGAQAKAAVICGCIGIVAEVSGEALKKRHDQGWVSEIIDDLDKLMARVIKARAEKEATSIGYHGNVVDIWERFVQHLESTGELLVDLGSDQTSCHAPFSGGYYPVQLSFSEGNQVLAEDPERFKSLVKSSIVRQVTAINKLSDAGLFFWDYGNAFLLEARRAGADVSPKDKQEEEATAFRYPSYVQDIMGDIFSLGFGPFRWVCTSGLPEDLRQTDAIATDVLQGIIKDNIPAEIQQQYEDNLRWLGEADKHEMVVGSQARILYSDQVGRVKIAKAFNEAVATGKLKAPVVISRDHHDVSGTDSPFRETSNIYDGSAFTADMAVQNCIGDAFRGATWVALHNGGGCGWGEVMNGGFGLVLDGSDDAERKAINMLNWDVSNGVARRSWSGNENARKTIYRAMSRDGRLRVTMPHPVSDLAIVSSA